MNELQSKLLDILKWFHNFCEEHNLQYFLIGGTLLGAIRHKGFIPWDDDIDVGMPREDYMRMVELSKKLNDPIYEIVTPYSKDKAHLFLFGKVYDKRTTLIETSKKRFNLGKGLYIDIFPIDNCGKNMNDFFKLRKRINKKKWFFDIKLFKTRQPSLLRAVVAGVITHIPFIRIPTFNQAIKIDKVSASCKNSEYVGNIYGLWGDREIVQSDYIFNKDRILKKALFEGLEFYIVNKPHEFLTNVYGDYMKLPPEEKRVSHHDREILLMDVPYEEYIRNNKK